MWYFQPQHRSVRDFLLSVRHDGPAADDPEKVKEMNLWVAKYVLGEAKSKGWGGVLRYGREQVVQHLFAREKPKPTEKAIELLTDPEYLQATLGDEPSNDPF